MKEERVLTLDNYEYGVVVNALNELRNDLIKDDKPTDAVDELLLKTIDAPARKQKRRSYNEAR
jgi:predicted N-formylglutamate amidohydrolase